jgi:hypothetical protein
VGDRETKVFIAREGLNLLFSDQIIRRSSVHPSLLSNVANYTGSVRFGNIRKKFSQGFLENYSIRLPKSVKCPIILPYKNKKESGTVVDQNARRKKY